MFAQFKRVTEAYYSAPRIRTDTISTSMFEPVLRVQRFVVIALVHSQRY